MNECEIVFDKYKWCSIERMRNGKTFEVSIFIDHPASNYEVIKGRGMTIALALANAEEKLTRQQLNIVYAQFLEMHKDEEAEAPGKAQGQEREGGEG